MVSSQLLLLRLASGRIQFLSRCYRPSVSHLHFPAAQKTLLIIPLGIAAFVVFYFVFLFAIKKFDLKTPGREDDDDLEEEKKFS